MFTEAQSLHVTSSEIWQLTSDCRLRCMLDHLASRRITQFSSFPLGCRQETGSAASCVERLRHKTSTSHHLISWLGAPDELAQRCHVIAVHAFRPCGLSLESLLPNLTERLNCSSTSSEAGRSNSLTIATTNSSACRIYLLPCFMIRMSFLRHHNSQQQNCWVAVSGKDGTHLHWPV